MSFDTGHFVRKTGGGVKKHAVSLSFAAVLSTVMPVLIQWHDEAREEKAIAAAIEPLQREIDDLKSTNQAQWQAIGKKQDKK